MNEKNEKKGSDFPFGHFAPDPEPNTYNKEDIAEAEIAARNIMDICSRMNAEALKEFKARFTKEELASLHFLTQPIDEDR